MGASTFLPADGSAIVRARAAALLMSGQEGGNLPLGVLAVPLSEGDLRSTVAVVVEIAGPDLLRDTEGGQLPVEIFVYGLGGKQEVLGQANLAVSLDLDRHGDLLAATGLKVVTALRLLPGEHLIRVLVRTAAGGFGARSYRLDVPKPGALRASAPLVEEEAGWLVLTDPANGAGGPKPYPLTWGGQRRVPAATVRLGGPGPWNAWVIAGDLGTAPAFAARFRTLDPGAKGEAPTEVPMAVEDRVHLLDDTAFRLRLANPGLRPGRYAMTLVASSEEGSGLESPPVLLWVEGPISEGGEPSRIAAAEGESEERPPAGRREATGKSGRKAGKGEKARKRDVEAAPYVDGYRRVLAAVSEGEQAAVGRSLDRLVETAWSSLEEDAPQVLGEALALLLTEEEDSWRILLPVIQAHLDLAKRSLEDWKYSLAQFGSRTALDLALARAAVDGTEAAAQEAAAFATCLAEAYLGTGSRGLATALLDRALELDGDQEAALLLRAALLEKEGQYGESAHTLRRLVQAHPGHGEGQLRLAVQEVRLRQASRARRRFEDLLEGQGSSSWVQLIASQELARLHRDAGRLGQAEAVLAAAAERWPDNPRLKTLRAQLLDDGERYVLSRLLLAREGAQGGLSEREVYNRWPIGPVEDLAAFLRESAQEVLEAAHAESEGLAGAAR